MKKALLLLILIVIIAAQTTFADSFFSVTPDQNLNLGIFTPENSTVIVTKADWVSARVTFLVRAVPGFTALIVFPNGSQTNVTTSYSFDVFLPRTNFLIGDYYYSSSAAGTISVKNPVDITITSNTTAASIPDEIRLGHAGSVTFYWFEIQGKATVMTYVHGVPI